MDRYLPLLTLLAFAFLTALLFFAAWAAWVAPRRIRHAVAGRLGPRRIRAAVGTSWVYWLVMFLLALLVAAFIAYLSWVYLGVWLYSAADNWQDHLATLANRTLWVLQIPVTGLDYVRIVPLGIVLGAMLGVYAGVLLGTWLGTRVAARRFLITRAMF